jgi:NDP-sugar pyrophosphorylase family protein
MLNDQGQVIGIKFYNEKYQNSLHPNWVLLMAGGLGSRLLPLTEVSPKPLLKVGNKPLLETILDNFIEYGFKHFFISVNYKAEMFENYFGDGSRWGIEIKYLKEKEKKGTAGALSLLPNVPSHPVLVMNGDLLTNINFTQLLDFHMQHKANATMCVRSYDFQVPYGVTEIEGNSIISLDEKPMQQFFVNAGIYVLEPSVFRLIPGNTFFDMTDLFGLMLEEKQEISAFPIREYWLDIGKIEDLEKANGEFKNHF